MVVMLRGAAVVLVVSIGAGCHRTVEDEPPLVESRIGPCTIVCESVMSECGPNWEDPGWGGKKPPKSLEACVQGCAGDDPGDPSFWAPQPDGTDACAPEWNAKADCLAELSCEEQIRFWNDPRTGDYPCKATNEAVFPCWSEHSEIAP